MPKKQPMIKTTSCTRRLQCKMTDAEVLSAAETLADSISEKRRLEEELNSIKKTFQADIALQDAVITRQQHLVSQKYELRDVVCDQHWNYEAGTFRVVRNDTFDEIECRPLREDERQMKLEEVTEEEGDES